MSKFLEIIKSNDSAKALLNKIINLNENSLINGYVTITKNKGKENEEIIQTGIKNLLTTTGRDYFHKQNYVNTVDAQSFRGTNVIALTLDPGTPNDGNTTLPSEITGNGLQRVEAVSISHTVGSNVTTLQNTFTATIAFADIHQSALFNKPLIGDSSNQMSHIAAFTSDVTLAIGDTITVTWTLTLG